MGTISNEVFDEPFTAIELTNSINRLPHRANSLDAQFAWEVTRSPTTHVRINMSDGKVEVAPYVPRGGVPPVLHGTKRKATLVEIPGIAGRASAMNREALNVAAGLTGEARLQSLELLRDGKNKEIAVALDEGEARQSAEAIKGLITDPQTGEEIVDLYGLQGRDQVEVDLDLTDSKRSLNDQIEEIKEISEDALGGIKPTGFKLIMGDTPSRQIRASQGYKDLLTAGTVGHLATIMAAVDGRRDERINDNVTMVHYRKGYFAPTDAFLVPVYDGHAQMVYGPHEADEFWGQVLPRYVTSEPMPHGKGVEMEGWAFVLRYFQHPEAILKLKVIGPK